MNIRVKRKFGLCSLGGIVAGIISLWVADLLCLLIGIIAVFLSIWGFRRGERFNTLGMFLGGIAVLFVNFQFMGIVKGNSGVDKDIKHVFNSIVISTQAYEILKNSAHKQLSEENIRKIIIFLEKAIKESRKVNIDNLDRYIPGFAKHYRKEFIKGLELLTEGFKNSDNIKKLQGAFLLDSWGIWNNKNRDKYKDLLKRKVSFVKFLQGVFKD